MIIGLIIIIVIITIIIMIIITNTDLNRLESTPSYDVFFF